MKTIIAEKAPKAGGPFSHAVETNGMLFVSGQLSLVPETMAFPSEDVVEQTKQCLANLKSILDECGVAE